MFRIAWPELLPTPPSTHTSLQLEKHYIGCQLSTVLSLRLPCWYISSYTVVTPNTLNPSSFPDIVHITLVEVNLMAYFPHFGSIFKSRKHFGLSFAYDAPMIWNDRSIFKTAMLVYKFLHSGNPKYFEPFLIPRHSAYNTRRSQSDGIFSPLWFNFQVSKTFWTQFCV